MLAAGSIASGCFALTLAWAPNPVAIAGLWVLSGLAWAAVMPIQQAVIAEASGERVGRGMGLYESAALAGGLVGSLGAGLLYDAASWQAACVVAAAVIASGAVIVPRSVRMLGVADVPVERGADVGEECRSGGDIHPQNATPPADARDGQAPGGSPAPEPAPPRPPATTGSRLRDLRSHALLYLVAQVSLVLVGSSWLFDLASGDASLLNGGGGEGLDGVLTAVGRVWTIVLICDALWTLAVVARARARARRER